MTTLLIIFTLMALIVYAAYTVKLKSKLSSMETELDTLKNDKSSIAEENINLREANDLLKSSNELLLKDKCSLEKENKELDRKHEKVLEDFLKATDITEQQHTEIISLQKLIEQLKEHLGTITVRADALTLENSALSVEILKLTERLADAEARLTSPITESISDKEIASRVMSLHQEDVNGQINAIISLLEKMRTRTFSNSQERKAFCLSKNIFSTASFIRRFRFSGENCLTAFITPELIEFVHENNVRLKFKFSFTGTTPSFFDVSETYDKRFKAGWPNSEVNLPIYTSKCEFYRALGYGGLLMNFAHALLKKISLAETCGTTALKNNSELAEKLVYQFDTILEEDVKDIEIVLYYPD